ncbi:hypothetical protein [Actinoplanes flavus]|uniref:DUF222 domain-containing protein n=1 Tax=Actinoplanes flavus TaxID=2820290 RepID=A0ABS3UFJ7_9ACTN|nr:hypothetical protein [Actinoplanes flavus]MBO3736548.1 hypothetical protein [Actinoplanes flavus]
MLYLREDTITEPVDRFLRDELAGDTLTATLRGLADAHYRAELARHQGADQSRYLRQTIEGCDNRIKRYRAALDAGGDPTLIASWISETSAERDNATAALRLSEAPPQQINEGQTAAIVDGLGSLLTVLRDADPRDKAELHSRIGLRMTYRPGLETLIAEVSTPASSRVFDWCPRIDTHRYPVCRMAIYNYSIELVHEEPVREKFTRTGSSLHGFCSCTSVHEAAHARSRQGSQQRSP